MKKISVNQNEKGLTLIEILASLVIISIVLISFSTILLQATKHTKYNKEKLTEVDIAEEVIGEIREDNNCEAVQAIVETVGYKEHYKITLTCDADGEENEENIPKSLKRALVEVESTSSASQKKSAFTTETYYKVGAGS